VLVHIEKNYILKGAKVGNKFGIQNLKFFKMQDRLIMRKKEIIFIREKGSSTLYL
jgi:hypothetical protein